MTIIYRRGTAVVAVRSNDTETHQQLERDGWKTRYVMPKLTEAEAEICDIVRTLINDLRAQGVLL